MSKQSVTSFISGTLGLSNVKETVPDIKIRVLVEIQNLVI